jgi:hypothetical protein
MGFEHGPLIAQANGSLLHNPLSWNNVATMVYIEQPAGVGFSYSSDPSDYNHGYNDTVAASDNAAFLTAFFIAYPRYANLDLFLTAESYGGNYVPQWAAAILAGSDAKVKAALKGFAVNNPVFSIDENRTFGHIMSRIRAEQLYGHSLIPKSFYDAYKAAGCAAYQPPQDPCQALEADMNALVGSCHVSNFQCSDALYISPFGNTTLGPATVATNNVEEAWIAWLNTPAVWAAIHAQTPREPWASCGGINYDVTWPSSLPTYAAAFAAGLRVLVWSGDVDLTTCPFPATQLGVEALTGLPGGEITSNWTQWIVAPGGVNQTAGYIERHAAFDFVTAKGAGHEAPGFQPYSALTLFSNFLAGTIGDLVARPQKQPAVPANSRVTQGSALAAAVAKTSPWKPT